MKLRPRRRRSGSDRSCRATCNRRLRPAAGCGWRRQRSITFFSRRATSRGGLVLSTYAGLCRLASDRGNASSVSVSMSVIAKQAGCSRRTVIRTLKELERVKLIAVRRFRRGNRNDENTYFLLACPQRRSAKAVVSEKHNGGDGESSGVVTENGQFPVTELKERRNSKSSSYSLKAKAPLAAAADADAQQQPGRFANEDGRKVRGLGSW